MATKIAVALEDDLSGGPANETVRFGLGGFDYEIDLSKKKSLKLPQKTVDAMLASPDSEVSNAAKGLGH